MIRRLSIVLSLALLAGPATADTGNAPTPVKTVLNSAKRKEKVLVAGKIKRARTLDIFVLADETGEVLINAANIRMPIAVGNDLVVWGRFWGRSDQQPDYREIEVIDAAQAGTAQAAALIDAHSRSEPRPAPAPVAPVSTEPVGAANNASTPSRTTESRLRELDDLKSKGLVNDAEYQDQRKRILSGL